MKKYRLEEQLRLEDINSLFVQASMSKFLHIIEITAITLIVLKLMGVFS